MKKLKLGFIPLTDCAPLVLAKTMGLFEKYDLDVELVKEVSWANIRDKVATGALQGAQMLASMPISASLGVGGIATPMLTAMVMDLNGNAITVSRKLYDRINVLAPDSLTTRPITALGLKAVIDDNNKAKFPRLRFAVVFPTSTHNYELRYWLASAGIDPDTDVEIIVIPPQQMVENLRSGNIDGFCVGEPWNSQAIKQGLGHSLITKYEIWNNSPEKVFGVTREWAEHNEETHLSAIKALLEAAKWLDASKKNRLEAAEILSHEEFINTDIDIIKMSMTGTFQYNPNTESVPMNDFNVFYRYSANFPWYSHALWLMSQMIRWGHIRQPFEINKLVKEIYRPDIYREAMLMLGETVPATDYKNEGEHSKAWSLSTNTEALSMGSDSFFDGKKFTSDNILAYLEGFAIKHPSFDLKLFK